LNLKFFQYIDKTIGKILNFFIILLRFLNLIKIKKRKLKNSKNILFFKLLGGGNIFILLPYFYNLKKKYPEISIDIICSNRVINFARNAKIFNNIIVLNVDSFWGIFIDTIKLIFNKKRNSVIINLEPYSNFSNLICSLIKNDYYIATKYSNSKFYPKIADEVVDFNKETPVYDIHKEIFQKLNVSKMETTLLKKEYIYNNKYLLYRPKTFRVGLIPFCSNLSKERMLSIKNWAHVLNVYHKSKFDLFIFGNLTEHKKAIELSLEIKKSCKINKITLLTKNYSFDQKIQEMLNIDQIYSIDTGYNHIARILDKKITSYWGPSDPKIMLDYSYTKNEIINYSNLPCSPCIHVESVLPCKGNNICMEIIKNKRYKLVENADWLSNV